MYIGAGGALRAQQVDAERAATLEALHNLHYVGVELTFLPATTAGWCRVRLKGSTLRPTILYTSQLKLSAGRAQTDRDGWLAQPTPPPTKSTIFMPS